MNPGRWQRLVRLFNAVLEQEPEQRTSFLDAACARDGETRREVESLLEAMEQDAEFLATGALPSLQPPSPAPDLSGETVGPFRVLRLLASGGMGEVYLAERADGDLNQQVALKLLPRGVRDRDLHQRFLRERNILASLEHPHICKLLDGGFTSDGQPWFAMPFLEGAQSLTRYCDERSLGLAERVRLFQQVCAAVHAAHQSLIVHADLKPGNVLVTAQGQVSLVDFGIARLLHGRRPGEPTTIMRDTAERPLTPEYASPEQVRGEAPTTASDIYSLGVLLFELVAGTRPHRFETGSPQEVLRVLESESTPAPSAVAVAPARRAEPSTVRLRRALSGDLDNIILKAMATEPSRRYASASALLEDLQRWRDGLPVLARPASVPYHIGKFVRRHVAAVTAGSVALLALVAFAVLMTLARDRLAQQAERIAQERDRAEAVAGFLSSLMQDADPVAGDAALSARELLDRGLVRLREDRALGPQERGALLGTLASAYHALGEYEVAREAAELALQPLAQGEDAGRNFLVAANTLADVEIRLGRGPEAVQAAGKAASLTLALPDVTAQERAGMHNRMAAAHQQAGDLDQALAHAEKALSIRRALPQEGDADDLAVFLSNMAQVHYQRARQSQGKAREEDLQRAEELIEEALALFRRSFGPAHPRIAFTLNARAALARERQAFADAAQSYQQAIQIAEDSLGPDHPFLAVVHKNYGDSLLQQGLSDEARGHLKTAERIARQAFPADSPIHARLSELIAQADGPAQP